MTSAIDYYMTHAEIGEELGITGSRVQQIEKRALKKIGRRMGLYVKPLEPKRSPVLKPEEESWESRYDRLYRESRQSVCGKQRKADERG